MTRGGDKYGLRSTIQGYDMSVNKQWGDDVRFLKIRWHMPDWLLQWSTDRRCWSFRTVIRLSPHLRTGSSSHPHHNIQWLWRVLSLLAINSDTMTTTTIVLSSISEVFDEVFVVSQHNREYQPIDITRARSDETTVIRAVTDKTCRCDSIHHSRTNHRRCPLNPRNKRSAAQHDSSFIIRTINQTQMCHNYPIGSGMIHWYSNTTTKRYWYRHWFFWWLFIIRYTTEKK